MCWSLNFIHIFIFILFIRRFVARRQPMFLCVLLVSCASWTLWSTKVTGLFLLSPVVRIWPPQCANRDVLFWGIKGVLVVSGTTAVRVSSEANWATHWTGLIYEPDAGIQQKVGENGWQKINKRGHLFCDTKSNENITHAYTRTHTIRKYTKKTLSAAGGHCVGSSRVQSWEDSDHVWVCCWVGLFRLG